MRAKPWLTCCCSERERESKLMQHVARVDLITREMNPAEITSRYLYAEHCLYIGPYMRDYCPTAASLIYYTRAANDERSLFTLRCMT